MAVLLGPHKGGGLRLTHTFEEIEAAIILGDMQLTEKMPSPAILTGRRMRALEIASGLIAGPSFLGARTRRLVRRRFHAYILELDAVEERIAVGHGPV